MWRISIVFLVLLLLFSCSKENKHSVRVHNSYGRRANNVRLNNDIKFGNLEFEEYSNSVIVDGGEYILKATIDGLPRESDPITIEGDGEHNWKIVILKPTQIYILEE